MSGAKPPNPRAEASSAPTNLVNVVGRGVVGAGVVWSGVGELASALCLRPGPGPSLQQSYAHPPATAFWSSQPGRTTLHLPGCARQG